ncbi:MAG: VWA domain-containing protein [Vicinamibacteria bacterium]
MIAFLYDRLSTEGRDTAHKAALAYSTRGHVDGDVVGVFQLDLALHTLQPFTTNLDAVKLAFERANMHAETPYASGGSRQDARDLFAKVESIDRSMAAMGGVPDAGNAANAAGLAVQREFNNLQAGVLQSFDRLERDQQGFSSTNGLMALVNGLKALPGRKTIVYFSEGLNVTSNVVEPFRGVIATANRANVSVYAIDVGGLRTRSATDEARRDLDATAAQRRTDEGKGYIDPSRGNLMAHQERTEDMLRMNPQAGLGQLAEQTGGFLVSETNDTARGFQRIQEEMRFYYLLSYSPTDGTFDGRYRSISVKISRPNVEVHSRKGYLALKMPSAVPVREFEAPAIAILDRRPLPNDFPLSATVLSFPESKRLGRVPVFVQFPSTVLAYSADKAGKTYSAEVSVVARIRDESGREVDRMSRNFPLTVAAAKLEAARKGDVVYFQETDLRPGHYTLEAVAFDATSKKASVRTALVEVPSAAPTDLRLSSLVLLQKVEKLSATEQKRDNPLYFGEAIVYPNAGEPYRKSQNPNLGFFFTAYAGAGAASPQATVELLKGGAPLARLPLMLPPPDADGRIQHAGALPIQALAAGEYALRLTVKNGAQTASQQAAFVVAE